MIFGKYQLLQRLAHNGATEVFKAKRHGVEGFEKLIAIKRVLPEYAENTLFVDRFVDRMSTAMTLNHANIVQVFDIGCINRNYYYAMEYVPGTTLYALLQATAARGQSFPHQCALFIAAEIAKGLNYAHGRTDEQGNPLNMAHQRITAHNILISREGEVKLTNFGFWEIDTLLTSSEEPVVPLFPEISGQQTDVRQLGMVLGRTLLTTVEPLPAGETAPALLQALTAQRLPGALVNLFRRAVGDEQLAPLENAADLFDAITQTAMALGTRLEPYGLSQLFSTQFPLTTASNSTNGALAGQSAADDVKILPERVSAMLPATIRDIVLLRFFYPNSNRQAVQSILETLITPDQMEIAEQEASLWFGLTEPANPLFAAIDFALVVKQTLLSDLGRLSEENQAAIVTAPLLVDNCGRLVEDDQYRTLCDAAKAERVSCGQIAVLGEAAKQLNDRYEVRFISDDSVHITGLADNSKKKQRLTGRSKELTALAQELGRAFTGKGGVVLLLGADGSGKSALIFEVKSRLEGTGHPYLWATAPKWGSKPPSFSTIRALLFSMLGAHTPATKNDRRLLQQKVTEILGDGPDLLAVSELINGEHPGNIPSLQRGFQRLLLELSRKQMIVLCVDDVHLVDEASHRFLTHLSTIVSAHPILLLLTCVPSLPHGFELSERFSEIRLSRLSADHIRTMATRLLHGAVSNDLVDQVVSAAHCQPALSLAYLQYLKNSTHLNVSGGQVTFEPPTVLHAHMEIRVRCLACLWGIPKDVQTVCRLAAVVGHHFDVILLSYLCETSVVELEKWLAQLEDLSIVAQVDSRQYAFHSRYLHQGLLDSLPTVQREAVHRRVAEIILSEFKHELPARSGDAAYHLARSGQIQSAEVHYLAHARDQLKQGDREEAAGTLLTALGLFNDSTDHPDSAMPPSSTIEELGALVSELGADTSLTASLGKEIDQFLVNKKAALDLDTRRQLTMIRAQQLLATGHFDDAGALLKDQSVTSASSDHVEADRRFLQGALLLEMGKLQQVGPLLQQSCQHTSATNRIVRNAYLANAYVLTGNLADGSILLDELDVKLEEMEPAYRPFAALDRIHLVRCQMQFLVGRKEDALTYALAEQKRVLLQERGFAAVTLGELAIQILQLDQQWERAQPLVEQNLQLARRLGIGHLCLRLEMSAAFLELITGQKRDSGKLSRLVERATDITGQIRGLLFQAELQVKTKRGFRARRHLKAAVNLVDKYNNHLYTPMISRIRELT